MHVSWSTPGGESAANESIPMQSQQPFCVPSSICTLRRFCAKFGRKHEFACDIWTSKCLLKTRQVHARTVPAVLWHCSCFHWLVSQHFPSGRTNLDQPIWRKVLFVCSEISLSSFFLPKIQLRNVLLLESFPSTFFCSMQLIYLLSLGTRSTD